MRTQRRQARGVVGENEGERSDDDGHGSERGDPRLHQAGAGSLGGDADQPDGPAHVIAEQAPVQHVVNRDLHLHLAAVGEKAPALLVARLHHHDLAALTGGALGPGHLLLADSGVLVFAFPNPIIILIALFAFVGVGTTRGTKNSSPTLLRSRPRLTPSSSSPCSARSVDAQNAVYAICSIERRSSSAAS